MNNTDFINFRRRAAATGYAGNPELLSEIEHLIFSAAPFSFKAYKALTAEQRETADFGIRRHLRACEKLDSIRYEAEAIREIIIDAARNRPYWIELERENRLNREIFAEARNSGFIKRKQAV
jgi:hypothetical protein